MLSYNCWFRGWLQQLGVAIFFVFLAGELLPLHAEQTSAPLKHPDECGADEFTPFISCPPCQDLRVVFCGSPPICVQRDCSNEDVCTDDWCDPTLGLGGECRHEAMEDCSQNNTDEDDDRIKNLTLNIVVGIRGTDFVPGSENTYYTWLRGAVARIEETYFDHTDGDLFLIEAYYKEAWGFEGSVKAITDNLVEFIAFMSNFPRGGAWGQVATGLFSSQWSGTQWRYDKVNVLVAGFCSGEPITHEVAGNIARLRRVLEERHDLSIDSIRMINLGPNYSFGSTLAIHLASLCPPFWPDCLGGATASFGAALTSMWAVITSAAQRPPGVCGDAVIRSTDNDYIHHDPFKHEGFGDLYYRRFAEYKLKEMLGKRHGSGIDSDSIDSLQLIWEMDNQCKTTMLQ